MKMIPDVDMSSGVDADGDGIDDGLEANKMQGSLDISSITWNRGKGWESDRIYPTIRIGGWKAVGDIQKSEGNKSWEWGTSLTSKDSTVHTSHSRGYDCYLQGEWYESRLKPLGDMKVIIKPVLATLGSGSISR